MFGIIGISETRRKHETHQQQQVDSIQPVSVRSEHPSQMISIRLLDCAAQPYMLAARDAVLLSSKHLTMSSDVSS